MNLDDTFHRRNSDSSPLDIERLIAQEDDPKVRAQLLIMNSINNSMIASTDMTIANTRATESLNNNFQVHLKNFSDHVKTQDEIRNKGRGAWWVLSWVLGAGWVVTLGFVSFAWGAITGNQRAIADLQITDIRQDGRITQVERVVQERKVDR